jgi:hypothetical protein
MWGNVKYIQDLIRKPEGKKETTWKTWAIDWRILKWILKKYGGWVGVNWINVSQEEAVAGSREYGTKRQGSYRIAEKLVAS